MIVRAATEKDAEGIAALLGELGYPNSIAFAADRISEFSKRESSIVLVAAEDRLNGFICFDVQPLFHQEGNIGCIMALCVDQASHSKGVGRTLVSKIEEIAKDMGCVKIAVASGVRREEAHRFYTSLGYEENTKRFVKQLC
jgi:GNAT superfamily N-acetyltransferase